jgi:hypothetical protein
MNLNVQGQDMRERLRQLRARMERPTVTCCTSAPRGEWTLPALQQRLSASLLPVSLFSRSCSQSRFIAKHRNVWPNRKPNDADGTWYESLCKPPAISFWKRDPWNVLPLLMWGAAVSRRADEARLEFPGVPQDPQRSHCKTK